MALRKTVDKHIWSKALHILKVHNLPEYTAVFFTQPSPFFNMIVRSFNTMFFGVLCSAFIMTTLATAVLPPSDQPEQTPESDFCAAAYNTCLFKFIFHDTVPTFNISGMAMKAFTPSIILGRRTSVSGVRSDNVNPEFLIEGEATEITNYGEPPFSSTHFKFVPIHNGIFYAIAHEEFENGQLSFAENRCIRLFITSYHIATLVDNPEVIHFPENTDNCIVFRTA